MQAMSERETKYILDGSVQVDDAYLVPERKVAFLKVLALGLS
jgi:hypothetical protein